MYIYLYIAKEGQEERDRRRDERRREERRGGWVNGPIRSQLLAMRSLPFRWKIRSSAFLSAELHRDNFNTQYSLTRHALCKLAVL